MDTTLTQILNTDQQRTLGNVRAAASRIWSRPLHRNYTDHTVAHSERVIALLDGLTEGVTLSPTEVFVLLAAAYLHDIGMQNERFAGGGPSTGSGQALAEIRAIHHEITAEMIYQAVEDPAQAVRLGLPDDPGLVEAIALVAKGHRRVDLNAGEYEPLTHGDETIRLRLLAALLRFADELDIDHRRVDLELLKVMNVPLVSQLHWCKCHYVSGVSIRDGYIRVTYRFPRDRPDYEDLIIPLVETDIREKLADLEETLWSGGVKVALGRPQVRLMRLLQPLPAEVEALARQGGTAGSPPQPAPPTVAQHAEPAASKPSVPPPSPITYATLEIIIGQKTGDGYPVRVRPSEAIPGARGTLKLDPESDPIRSLVQEIEHDNPQRGVLTEFGGLLFERLFCGEVAASFHRGWGAVSTADQGLRIQLDIEPPGLATLPWEYLYYAAEEHFFAISTDTPLTRFVSDLRTPLDVLEVEGQLRMLLLAASPEGVPSLDLDGAIANVTGALDGVPGMESLPVVRDATPRAIREAMRQGRPHIVHFVGHGYFEGDRAGVVLDDGSGRARRLGADQFARLFQAPPGVDGVRLLVLNACQGAKASSTRPLVGVAHNALRYVPAVVAMQYPVTDAVARSFAHEFYRSLAVRYPVDAVVSEARNALYIDYGGDWGTPVLFLRSRDGRLFGPGTREQAVRAGAPLPVVDTAAQETVADQEESLRVKELDYLDALLERYDFWLDHYTPLAGIAEVRAAVEDGPRLDLPMPFIPRGFEKLMARDFGGETRREPVDDLCQAIRQHRRIILLGDPGSGKTTTLWRLAYDYALEAKEDSKAPLPVFVPLGGYTDDGPFDAYLARHLGGLALHLEAYRASGRLVLLLDGLNEMPQADYERRVGRIRAALERYPDGMAIVTCRALDYVVELSALQRVEVSPLDHDRIRTFLHNYLGETAGERLYQALWRGEGVQALWETWQAAGGTWEEFWTAEKMPDNVYSETSAEQDALWSDLRKGLPLLSLVRNPYMLLMTAQVYARAGGVLPANQARLFEAFVDTLLEREKERNEGEWIEAGKQQDGLAALAYAMQAEGGGQGTMVSRERALGWLCRAVPDCDAQRLLYLTMSATLLDASATTVRFYHQLLQEYFAARELGRRVDAGGSLARYWPEGWWTPSGWEETFILLAGMEAAASALLVKLAEANPVVAGRCLLEGGVGADQAARDCVVNSLVVALGEERASATARVQAGDTLARLGDPRPGVGLGDDGLPDIAWCEVPAGLFLMGSSDKDEMAYGDEKPQRQRKVSAFQIAKYPVTNAQYRAFVQDRGYTERWRDCWTEAGWAWKGDRTGPETYGGAFDLPNHPVVEVTWYEAVAFCGWLTEKLREIGKLGEDEAVTLPSEAQWEKAARGTDGRIYPWGDEADPNRANYDDTGIRATSAVGCFPGGASPCGAEEMSGNVWEWCATKWQGSYENYRDDNDLAGDDTRVVRGGSWYYDRHYARCASRDGDYPDYRFRCYGFRVVVSPIS